MTVVSRFTYSAIAKSRKLHHYTRLNGTSWLQFEPVTLAAASAWDVTLTVYIVEVVASDRWLWGTLNGETGRFSVGRSGAGTLKVFIDGTTSGVIDTGISIPNSRVIDINVYSTGSAVFAGVDGEYSQVATVSNAALVSLLGRHSTAVPILMTPISFNINNQHFYPLDEPYDSSLIYRDTIGGNDAQGYNITSDDVTQELV